MMPSSVSLELLGPPGLVLLALAAVLLVLALRLYGSPRWPLLALRLGSVLLVVLLLLEPVLAFFAEREAPARIALLADASLSMTIPFPEAEAPEGAPAPTRAERLAKALDETDLVDALAEKGKVDAYRFGGSVEPLAGENGELDLTPRDDRTDLAQALSEGVGALRSRTGAVVLLSDGSHNVGSDPRAAARRLGVPVFAVGVGSEGPVTDLSVFDVIASGVSYLDNVVPVEAKLRARGDAAPGVVVYLSEGDAKIDSTTIDLPGGGIEGTAELQYTPQEEGLHVYRVWTPARENELSAENNEHLFAVRVLREKIRVLLVASRPSFDFTFLKRALEADVSLAVDATIRSLARYEGALGRRGKSFPDKYAELARYDLVVLLDMDGTDLGERVALLARFVEERGGALLVMGSSAAFELGGTQLQPLLPFVSERGARPRRGQVLPRLTQSGRTHPVTTLEGEELENARLWSELPPLTEAPLFQQRRPEARVLVVGEVDGVAREEMPLVATLETGRGRVLAIAGGPYWRWDLYLWGTGRSGDAFQRLVSRSVRWLVARDELKQVLVRPAKNLFDGAETVIIEGQVYDDDFRPIEGADVRATVLGPLGTEDERPREISLVDIGGGRYRGSLPGLPPGDYQVDGAASLGDAALGEDRSELTVAPYRMEFEDPAPDFSMLSQIAQESGGRFLPLAEMGELPEMLDLEPVVERSVKEWPFQEQPLVFLALLGLLGFEWALRRGRGLP